jgi:dolichol-phosphate mannosyltransferase
VAGAQPAYPTVGSPVSVEAMVLSLQKPGFPAPEAGLSVSPDVSIVIPTFNEQANVESLVALIDSALRGIPHEIVFVDDDSRDGTVEVLRGLCRKHPHVRMVHRIGRRGLSSAVVEGIQSTTSPFVAVMDADLQHDERLLPRMLEILRGDRADLVVGSRYVEGGGLGDWSQGRRDISRLATWLAGMVIRVPLTDPMSGFFMVKRSTFDDGVRSLSSQGYKILLDMVASLPAPPRIAEVPYTFRTRQHGESKLDAAVTWEYLMLLADKLVGHVIPVRFLMFLAVGGAGVFVHMAVLAATHVLAGQSFLLAQSIAMMVAMTFNFFVNNILTYRDRRLTGWNAVRGLFSFYAVCSIGAFANVGIAEYIHGQAYNWAISGFAGILVGAVWNYAASAAVTWRSK